MIEIFELTKVEQKIDPQELWKKMTTIPETPGALRKTLSADNVRTFFQIITSPEAVEADWLYQCGYLTKEQVEQYIIASGNHYTSLQNLTDLALKISYEFRSHLIELVENDILGYRKEGINNLLRSIRDLASIGEGLYSNNNLQTINRDLADRFWFQVNALIGSDLIDLTENYNVDERIRNEIIKFIEFNQQVFQKGLHNNYPGISFHNEKTSYKRTFEKKENLLFLDKLINFTDEYDERKRSIINEENRSIFATISEQKPYKSIPLITLHDKNPQVIAIHDDTGMDQSQWHVTVVRLNFSEKMVSFPPSKKDNAGNIYRNFEILPDVIELTLNPKNGDLCFVSSAITGGISFKNQVISEDRYLALQNYILRKIKDYLESKEPDIEDLFVYSPSELKERSEKIEAEAKAIQPEELQDESVQELVELHAEIKPARYIPDEKDQLDQESLSDKYILPKHFRAAVMDRISGARAKAVIAALRRMLGNEEKTEGSHLIFRSQRNGITYPITLHSQKDRQHIALPLVLTSLKQWQYDPIELAMELGLKIPKKFMSE